MGGKRFTRGPTASLLKSARALAVAVAVVAGAASAAGAEPAQPVETGGGEPAAVTIPLPPAVWTGLSVLAGGGLWAARHRIRQWLK